MQDYHMMCPGCFAEKGEAAVCPHCSFDEQGEHPPLALPLCTLLFDQFLVGRVLGKPGGFGVTYLARDLKLQATVAVKEYLPRELAGRGPDQATVVPHSQEHRELFRFGLDQFLQEGRLLVQFDHPNIVRVRHFFEANGTGYLVMDYYEGMTLHAYLAQAGGRLAEAEAVEIMLPILDGLRTVHAQGVLHRDIDPHNIYLARRPSGERRPILLDFGAARVAIGGRHESLSVILKPGFAPFEQYQKRGQQGPWSDVYACAATLYRMVTGEVPPDAVERMLGDTLVAPAETAARVAPVMSAALVHALAVRPEDRPASIDAFRALLLGAEPAPATVSAGPSRPVPARPAPPRVRWWVAAGVGAALLVGGAYAWWSGPAPALPAGATGVVAVPTYETYRRAGDSLYARAALAAARRQYEQALAQAPEDAYVQARLAEIDRQLTPAAAPVDLYARYRAEGDTLFLARRYLEARARYEAALAQQPGDAYAQDRIATIEATLREWRQRVAQALTPVREAYGQARVHVNQGAYQDADRMYRMALRQLEAVAGAYPDQPEVLSLAAEIRQAQADGRRACEAEATVARQHGLPAPTCN